MSQNPYKDKLSTSDVKSLCDAAAKTWSIAGPPKKYVPSSGGVRNFKLSSKVFEC